MYGPGAPRPCGILGPRLRRSRKPGDPDQQVRFESDHAPGGRIGRPNRAGVEIFRRAAAGKALVFASIGPTGKLLMNAAVSRQDVARAFAAQAVALAAAGADALLVETMSDLDGRGAGGRHGVSGHFRRLNGLHAVPSPAGRGMTV